MPRRSSRVAVRRAKPTPRRRRPPALPLAPATPAPPPPGARSEDWQRYARDVAAWTTATRPPPREPTEAERAAEMRDLQARDDLARMIARPTRMQRRGWRS